MCTLEIQKAPEYSIIQALFDLANADNFDTVKLFAGNRQRKFRYCKRKYKLSPISINIESATAIFVLS